MVTKIAEKDTEELLETICDLLLPDSTQFGIECDWFNDLLVVNLDVPPDARGIIIGKDGETLRAIKRLVSCLSAKHSTEIYLRITEEEKRNDQETRNETIDCAKASKR